jgi:hypothetical protein
MVRKMDILLGCQLPVGEAVGEIVGLNVGDAVGETHGLAASCGAESRR